MTFITIARLAVLSITLFFSLVVLGLAAHWTSITIAVENLFWDFEGLALATAILSLLSLPVFLVLGALRKGAFPTMIIVELPVLSFLWVMWLATSALTATHASIRWPFGCGGLSSVSTGYCNEFFAIEGLAFVNWILLFGYIITLLTMTIIGQSRGNRVWMTSVNEANFFGRSEKAPVLDTEARPNAAYAAPAQTQMQQPYNVQANYPPTQYSAPPSQATMSVAPSGRNGNALPQV